MARCQQAHLLLGLVAAAGVAWAQLGGW